MTTDVEADIAVVGSGCTGAMAAETLVEAGVRVLMLDVGLRDERYRSIIPQHDFLSIRRTELDQHRYFLGDMLEGLPSTRVGSGPQLTPPRQHIVAQVTTFLPRASDSFFPVESLAYGGLGAGWGLGCAFFSRRELEAAGLDEQRMLRAYQIVGRRLGVSGTRDDAGLYTCAGLDDLLPSAELDSNGRELYRRYQRRRAAINGRGFYLGRPAQALLTRDRDGRQATSYRDMDFYDDLEQSAYRPWITVDRLRTRSTFEYRDRQLVLAFREADDAVSIQILDTETRAPRVVRVKRLVIAAGVLGTARIVLRSAGERDVLPVLCNPYSYIPCLQTAMLGRALDQRRTSLAQFIMCHDRRRDNFDVAQASIYSYGSLLLFRLVNEVPFNLVDARILMRYLLPALVIVGIHHPESASEAGRMRLESDAASPTGDRLAIEYPVSRERRRAIAAKEREFVRALRMLRCYALGHVSPPLGASIHYAGSLPYSTEERPLTLSRQGRLHGTRRVYVADGSGFRYLPAKGLTFSLMANAHNVAEAALRDA